MLEMSHPFPAQVAAATVERRARGRLWQLLLDVHAADVFYDAALAGCKYEFAFAANPAAQPAAGARVALAAYADVLPRFAADYARAIADLLATQIPKRALNRAKRIALNDPGLAETAANTGLRRALEDATEADVRAEALALWASIAKAAPLHGEALVAGNLDATAARKLVAAVYAALPTNTLDAAAPGALAAAPALGLLRANAPASKPEAQQPNRPSRILAARNTWDHPVASNACVASGVPALVATCSFR